ncbi:MAG TPA: hypothetical protein VMS77_03675 [Conexivisphaerales archaeon]|nr:hypothetical protein [Conexivisphaerales archaeon]
MSTPFTQNCDLYGAVHENGVNKIITHIMRQRPSLFNYGTADVAKNVEGWCSKVVVTQDVRNYNNPIFTVENYLPIFGADSPPVGLSFCAQLSSAKIDFHPSNVIKLPAELTPPLQPQRFAMSFRICGSIGCPPEQEVDGIQPTQPAGQASDVGLKSPPPVNLPGRLNCFCLDVYAIGHFERATILGKESLLGKLDDMDIVDIKPDALEQNIICYLKTAVNVILREKLTIPYEKFFFSFSLFHLATVSLSATPNPPIPNNPAVEDDQLKVFLTMKVGP